MAHTIEPAASGRAKCRGCGEAIAKDTLRLGERFPNPFADEGDMTVWLHLECGAYKRPETFLEALEESEIEVENREALIAVAEVGAKHRRLPRLAGCERASTGRARCRACKEMIPKDTWRIPLQFFDDGRFQPSGFIHVGCAKDYFDTADIVERLRHFAPELTDDDVAELKRELEA